MFYDKHPEARPKWGDRHLWARGYYVSTVGNVNEESIRNHIRFQEEYEKNRSVIMEPPTGAIGTMVLRTPALGGTGTIQRSCQ
ncbi:Transposase IS200 like [Lachnospiraceae bacterium]|nr:Transposase IS200 like [Lachnospiraceae bacterium]